MAEVHTFEISVRGKGGHGSQPQDCRDPIVAGAALIGALQTAVSRGLSAAGGAVVSVCSFEAGNTHNVIPEIARMTGTIRSFSAAVTERVIARVREIAKGIGATYGVTVDLALETGYPVLVNDPGCVAAVGRVAETIESLTLQQEGLPMAGGEDFAYFAAELPSAYFFLGTGREGEDTPGCHHPDFDFDDELIPTGMRMFLGLVRDRVEGT
jgi:amidohydrolase